jgi:hypothetical protein
MSSKDLYAVYKRISQRIKSGAESHQMINTFLAKRADAEDKISQIVLDLIPQKTVPDDTIMENIIEELKIEAAQHARVANDLRTLIINSRSGKPFATTQHENQKSIEKMLDRQIKELKGYIKDMDNSCENMHKERRALQTVRPEKRDSQQRKYAKATEECKRKTQLCDQFANQSKAKYLPEISSAFADFDKNRLMNLQENVQIYSQLKGRLSKFTKEAADRLNKKMDTFDAVDRSSRFVNSTLDPQAKQTEGNQDLYAVAISDFKSEEKRDLSFVRGDRIKVILQHNSGWWEGELNGRRGSFPATFVKLPKAKESKQEAIGSVLMAVVDYKPEPSSRDIEMRTGDLMFVEYLLNDKCTGKNLRNGEIGTFPLGSLEQKIVNELVNSKKGEESEKKPVTASNVSANAAAFAQVLKQ